MNGLPAFSPNCIGSKSKYTLYPEPGSKPRPLKLSRLSVGYTKAKLEIVKYILPEKRDFRLVLEKNFAILEIR